MRYTHLGRSGLKVSRIALGCMSFDVNGDEWNLDEHDSRELIRGALELGINFFDTANMYSGGESEEVLGRALRDFVRREEVVIATKLFFPMDGTANARGLSRKAIMREIDASLRRLGTDYVDLYQIHRWDYETPIEETLEALHDVVHAGKALYLGASSMYAWQFCRALHLADRNGWTRFIAMQNHYNLVHREEEREMLPLCRHEGIGVIPWSPYARGLLARPWGAPSSTDRPRYDRTAERLYAASRAADERVVRSVEQVARARGVPQAQIALAWLLCQPAVTAPIVGATQSRHLTDAVEALEIRLDSDEIEHLTAAYVPHGIVGYE